MEKKIVHRRLYAYLHSRVLNAMVMVAFVALLQAGYMASLDMPVVCASAAFVFFIGYSLWFWIKKPEKVVINKWLSGISSCLTLYFIIVGVMKVASPWWYIFPAFAAVLVLFINLVKPHEETFEI